MHPLNAEKEDFCVHAKSSNPYVRKITSYNEQNENNIELP